MLDITLYVIDREAEDSLLASESYEGYDYVSLVNEGTYGPPALVAPMRGEPPVARVGDRVLYVNTSCSDLAAFEIVRKADR